MKLDIGIICKPQDPLIDYETLRDKVTTAIRAAVPGVEMATARYPEPDQVRITIASEDLTTGEAFDITAALGRYGCQPPADDYGDLLWEGLYRDGDPSDVEDFAEEVAHRVWNALGDFVEVRVDVLTTCNHECPGCYARHQGWQTCSFNEHDYDRFIHPLGLAAVGSAR